MFSLVMADGADRSPLLFQSFMKTAIQILLLLAAILITSLTTSCREEESGDDGKVDRLRFNPVEGESWVYDVEVTLDPSARNLKGSIDIGPEGGNSRYEKVRHYLGLKPVADGSEELAHCFEVSKEGKVQEREFSQMTDRGIVTRAWQEAGKERLIMDEPILLVPAKKVPGSLWSRRVPNPNDPAGPPMFSRQFQYFGLEEILVLGEKRNAHRVKVVGITGQLELQRDFWFVNQIGFVKERKAYYSQKKRLILVEETLVSHNKVK